MKPSEYLKDHIGTLLVNAAGMIFAAVYLLAGGLSSTMTALLFIAWWAVLICFLAVGYRQRNRYFQNLKGLLDGLDKPYLLGELAERPYRYEDRIHMDLLRKTNKSVIEEIRRLEEKQQDYREYIESWVHDMKVPITGMELMCANEKEGNAGTLSSKIRLELARVENCVESVLFYAKSDSVYRDYLIRELDLQETIHQAIAKNKAFLIRCNMRIETDPDLGFVYSDEKWLIFILGQILINSGKYRKGDSGYIRFSGIDTKQGMRLVIEDHGIGERKSEIDRIFDKGFTGTNGRKDKMSTGMGLYLCAKLCRRIGLEISAESEEGQYTRIFVDFPKGDYHLSKM